VNQKTRNEDQCSVNGNEWDAHKQKQNRERENVIYTKLNSPWNCFICENGAFMENGESELFLLLEKQQIGVREKGKVKN
jgi:hypothetical protein